MRRVRFEVKWLAPSRLAFSPHTSHFKISFEMSSKRFQVSLYDFSNRCYAVGHPSTLPSIRAVVVAQMDRSFWKSYRTFLAESGAIDRKNSKGRCRLAASLCIRTPPFCHAARATAWEYCDSLHFGKQVSHMEPASASQNGLDSS